MDSLLPGIYRVAVTDDATFRDNPFVTREQRRQSRSVVQPLLLLLMVAVLLAGMVLALWLVRTLIADGRITRVPDWLDRSYGVMLLAVLSAIHLPFISQAAGRHSTMFFLQEYRRGTLPDLLTAVPSPFHLALQASVYPFRQAMLMAAAGLPFYIVTLHCGGVSVWDLAGLYTLFAMAACTPPRWRVPVFAGIRPEVLAKKRQRVGGGTGAESVLAFLGALFITGNLLSPIFGWGWQIRLVTPLWQEIPSSVTRLLPGVFAWLVAAERLLLTPLPFYSFVLPPILVVPVLYICGQILGLWLTSMYLRVEDTQQILSLWDRSFYRRAVAVYSFLLGFVVLGYLWRPYVASSLTASLVSMTARDRGTALAGLMWLLGLWGGWRYWSLVLWFPSARKPSAPPLSVKYLLEETQYAGRELLLAGAMFVIGCLLGGVWPFFVPAVLMAIQCLTTVVAGAFVVRAAASISRATARRAVYWTVLLLPLVCLALPGLVGFACLSPVGAMLALSPHTADTLQSIHLVPSGIPSWPLSAAMPLGLGILLTIRPKPKPVHPEAGPDLREDNRPRKRFLPKTEYPLAQRIIGWVRDRWDDAVAVKELRILLRGHLGPGELALFGLLLLWIAASSAYRPDAAVAVLEWPIRIFYGPDLPQAALPWAAHVTLWLLGAMLLMPLIFLAMGATAFPKERDRSTLGFLLVTPLSTGRILWGKLLGTLVPSAMWLAAILAWMLIASLPLAFYGHAMPSLVAWLLCAAILCVLCAVSGLFGVCASTLLRREADAVGLGLLALIGCIVAGSLIYSFTMPYSENTGPAQVAEWTACLALAGVASAMAAVWVARWRISAARSGDVAMGTGARR